MYVMLLKKYMKRCKINQSQLAVELHITRSHLSYIFSGRRGVGVKLIDRIIRLTGFCPTCGLSVK